MTATAQVVDDRGVTVTVSAGELPDLPGVRRAPRERVGRLGPSFSDPPEGRVLGEVRRCCRDTDRCGLAGLLVVRSTVESSYFPWKVIGEDPYATALHGWRHSEAVAGWERLGVVPGLAALAVVVGEGGLQ